MYYVRYESMAMRNVGTQTSLMFSGSSVSTQTDRKKESKVEFYNKLLVRIYVIRIKYDLYVYYVIMKM